MPRTRPTLLAAPALFATLLAGTPFAAGPSQSLRDAYADAFLFGTAVNDDIVSCRDGRSQALVKQHFDRIPPRT